MTHEEFQNTVIQPSFNKPVLVDFWADWCDPCKILEPILDELAKENSDSWSLVKIDTDGSKEVAAQFDIMGVPAIRIFWNGELIAKYNGLMWKKEMGKWILDQLGITN